MGNIGRLDGHDGVVDVRERDHRMLAIGVSVDIVDNADHDSGAEYLGDCALGVRLGPSERVDPRELADRIVDCSRVEISGHTGCDELVDHVRDEVLDLTVDADADALVGLGQCRTDLVGVVVGKRDRVPTELLRGVVAEHVAGECSHKGVLGERTGIAEPIGADDIGRRFEEPEIPPVADEVELFQPQLRILGHLPEHLGTESRGEHGALHVLVGELQGFAVAVERSRTGVRHDDDPVLTVLGVDFDRGTIGADHDVDRTSGHRNLFGVGARDRRTLCTVAHQRYASGIVDPLRGNGVVDEPLATLLRRGEHLLGYHRDLDQVAGGVVSGVEGDEPPAVVDGLLGELVPACTVDLRPFVYHCGVPSDDREVSAAGPPHGALSIGDDLVFPAEKLDLALDVLLTLTLGGGRLDTDDVVEKLLAQVDHREVAEGVRIGGTLLHPALDNWDHAAHGHSDMRTVASIGPELHDVRHHAGLREGRGELVEE